jgi:hypothetical protein
VIFKGGDRENRIYLIIAVIIISVIVITVFFSSNTLFKAFIEDETLGDDWYEDITERKENSQLFGLENLASFTYRNNNESYPAYVTVTSIKLLLMMNENDLLDKTEETLNKASEQGIVIDIESRVSGEREISKGHKSKYIIYDGNDSTKEPFEKIKIIGETWNCGDSGTSIICIGVAQITNHDFNNSNLDTTYWEKIVDMQDGLIYNVKCN